MKAQRFDVGAHEIGARRRPIQAPARIVQEDQHRFFSETELRLRDARLADSEKVKELTTGKSAARTCHNSHHGCKRAS